MPTMYNKKQYTGHRQSYGAPKVEAGLRSNEVLPTPNKYGIAILEELKNSNRNIAIRGVAGCGKTTMLRQIVASLTPLQRQRTTVIAFGSDIAKELKVVLPVDVDSSTAHSKGLKMLRDSGTPTSNIDANKYNAILKNEMDLQGYNFEELGFDELQDTDEALKLCQLNLVDPLSEDFSLMLAHYGISPYKNMAQSIAVAIAYGASDEGILRHGISFTDMVYLPIRKGLKPSYTYDLVLVDECQDLSNALARLAKMHMSPSGRMIVVGDLQDMGMEAAPNAVDGVITNHSYDDGLELLISGDMVVCRTNAPILGMAFALLKKGKQVTVPGREITTQVANLAKKILGKKPFSSFLDLLPEWLDNEVMMLSKRRNSEIQIATAQDKKECLTILAEKAMSEGITTISGFTQFCKNLFPNKTQSIKLCSVHKAKGLEANRVFILQPELMPLKMPQKWQQEQELFLKNVALTRSKNHLGFIAKKRR